MSQLVHGLLDTGAFDGGGFGGGDKACDGGTAGESLEGGAGAEAFSFTFFTRGFLGDGEESDARDKPQILPSNSWHKLPQAQYLPCSPNKADVYSD